MILAVEMLSERIELDATSVVPKKTFEKLHEGTEENVIVYNSPLS